jgi:hypothetical protein
MMDSNSPDGPPGRMPHRALRRVAALAALAYGLVILALTLYPTGGDPDPWALCLICGTRGTADAVLNLLFFVPFGAALVLSGVRPRVVVLVGFALSLAIETAQMGVPGRDSSFGDLLFNTLGGAIGAGLVATRGWWWTPTRRVAARLSLVAGIGAALTVAGSGLVMSPAFPWASYYGQWTPDLAHLEPYDGRVLSAQVGGHPVAPWFVRELEPLRDALIAREPIIVEAVAGTPPPELASLFSVYDSDHREILLIGPRGDDLVYRTHTRATYLRLHHPERSAGGLLSGIEPGDPLRIEAEWRGAEVCLRANDREACGLGFTAGSGWRLLYDRRGWSDTAQALLSLAWVLSLGLPFGFWARRRPESWVGGAVLLAGLLVVPGQVGLLSTPGVELAAMAVGVGAGMALGRLPRLGEVRGGGDGDVGGARAGAEQVKQLA